MAEENPSTEGDLPVVETPPVAEPPAVEPVVETPAEPVVEIPAEPEAPAEETPAEPVVEAPVEEAPAPAEEVPEPPAEEPVEEAPKPTYEAFKLPDGIQAAPEQITAYTDVLGEFGISQEAGQRLMDLHATALKEMYESQVQRQTDTFNEMRRDWVAEFDKRTGNRRDTVLNDAKFAVTDTIKSVEKRKAFWGALGLTGAGDHPDVVEGLAAIGKRLREGSAPPIGLPAKSNGGLTPAQRRYGVQS